MFDIDFQANDFKALVYENMENKSLEDCLHPKVTFEGVCLRLKLRMSHGHEVSEKESF